ncbi:MAG TPA: phospholipid-binding protein, partial [Candidatus Limnocylindria bacterium]|nr:phospholipid-binding protein [Candidatus Limnocylindria bacterium]
ALDLNHDGVIDADEIAQASASLKKLDKNGDGKLTPDELRPPRPAGPGGPGGPGGQGRPEGPEGEGRPPRPAPGQ